MNTPSRDVPHSSYSTFCDWDAEAIVSYQFRILVEYVALVIFKSSLMMTSSCNRNSLELIDQSFPFISVISVTESHFSVWSISLDKSIYISLLFSLPTYFCYQVFCKSYTVFYCNCMPFIQNNEWLINTNICIYQSGNRITFKTFVILEKFE